MNINDITVGFSYIDNAGVTVTITALPGKLKSFQCTTSDRPGQTLKITRLQLIRDINEAREIFA